MRKLRVSTNPTPDPNQTTVQPTTTNKSSFAHTSTTQTAPMISDASLYSLAIFLGSASMLLIVLYHFLEINAKDDSISTPLSSERKADALPSKAR